MTALSTLYIALTADTSEFEEGMSRAERMFGTVTTAASVVAAGAAVAGTAVLAVGAAALDTAVQFDEAEGRIQSQLNLTAEETAALGDVVRDVYGNGYGESIAAAGAAVGEVALQTQRLGEVSNDTIEQMTVDALALADAYEVDFVSSTNAAVAVMDTFGLSGEAAFDLIAYGMQNGLNASDDYLDSLGEYAPVFAGIGLDAEDMFNILETGAEAGVLGVDKIADAVKEMGLKLNEGSKETQAAFATMGMDYEALAQSVRDGEAEWGDYFDEIVAGLNDIDDPIAKQAAQVAVFGTMAEDMGVSFTEGLSTMETALADMAGATDALGAQYEDLPDILEVFKRRGLVAIEPVGKAMLNLAMGVMPLVEQGFAWFESSLIPLLVMASDKAAGFVQAIIDGTSPVNQMATEMVAFVEPLTSAVGGFVAWQDILVVVAGSIMAVVIPAIVSMVAAALPIVATVGAAIAAVALLRNAWENDWGGIQEKTATAVAFVQGVIGDGLAFVQGLWVTHGDEVMTSAGETWTWLKETFSQGVKNARSLINSGLRFMQDLWKRHGNKITGLVDWAWGYVEQAYNNAVTILTGIQTAFRAWQEGDWFAFGSALRTIVDGIWDNIKLGWEMGKAAVIGATTAVIDGVKNAFANVDWGAVGRNVISKIGDGISSAAGWLVSAAKAAAKAAYEAAMG